MFFLLLVHNTLEIRREKTVSRHVTSLCLFLTSKFSSLFETPKAKGRMGYKGIEFTHRGVKALLSGTQ